MRVLLLVLIVAVAWGDLVSAGDEPEKKSAAWLLKFEPLDVNSIVVERESGRGRLEWYMVYSVKNEGDQPRPCDLRITAEMLDTEAPAADAALGEAGLGGPKPVKAADILLPVVEEAVERKLGENLLGPADVAPLRRGLASQDAEEKRQALGKLKELLTIKPKEVKRCLATFGALDAQTDAVRIYVRNLTGTIGARLKDGKRIVEEYVLVLTYKIPGDEFGMSEDRFAYVGRKWIKVEREVPAPPTATIGAK